MYYTHTDRYIDVLSVGSAAIYAKLLSLFWLLLVRLVELPDMHSACHCISRKILVFGLGTIFSIPHLRSQDY